MANLFSPQPNYRFYDFAILVLRVFVGIFMLIHGLQKLTILMAAGPISFPDPLGVGSDISLMLTVFAEAGCSLLIIAGLATRLATIPLMIAMIVAVFVIHGDHDFAKKELGSIYLLIYFVLLITGAGKYSLDHLINRKSGGRHYGN